MQSKRVNEVDVIRLVALVGICIVNVPFMALPEQYTLTPVVSGADQWVASAVAALLQLKFFLLFSFVFGWGVAVQADSAGRAGVSFHKRYFTRLALLGVIGLLHALLVFRGDILVLYACLGALLFALRERTASDLFRIARRLLVVAAIGLCVAAIVLDELGGNLMAGQTEGTLAGSFADAVLFRTVQWPLLFPVLLLVQGPLALAAFVAGLGAAKADFFSPASDCFNRLKKNVPILLIWSLPLNLFYGISSTGLFNGNEWLQLAAFVSLAGAAPALAAVFLWLLVVLSRRVTLPAILVYAGRNSLSAYVLQGVLGGLVFGGYGLGFFGKLDYTTLTGVAMLIALTSLLAVGVWVSAVGRGPLELLLRLGTPGRESQSGKKCAKKTG